MHTQAHTQHTHSRTHIHSRGPFACANHESTKGQGLRRDPRPQATHLDRDLGVGVSTRGVGRKPILGVQAPGRVLATIDTERAPDEHNNKAMLTTGQWVRATQTQGGQRSLLVGTTHTTRPHDDKTVNSRGRGPKTLVSSLPRRVPGPRAAELQRVRVWHRGHRELCKGGGGKEAKGTE